MSGILFSLCATSGVILSSLHELEADRRAAPLLSSWLCAGPGMLCALCHSCAVQQCALLASGCAALLPLICAFLASGCALLSLPTSHSSFPSSTCPLLSHFPLLSSCFRVRGSGLLSTLWFHVGSPHFQLLCVCGQGSALP